MVAATRRRKNRTRPPSLEFFTIDGRDRGGRRAIAVSARARGLLDPFAHHGPLRLRQGLQLYVAAPPNGSQWGRRIEVRAAEEHHVRGDIAGHHLDDPLPRSRDGHQGQREERHVHHGWGESGSPVKEKYAARRDG
jgi:hypothetical protein